MLLSAYACISTGSEGVHNSAVQSACVLNRVPYTDQHLTAELVSECQLVLVEYAEHVSTSSMVYTPCDTTGLQFTNYCSTE